MKILINAKAMLSKEILIRLLLIVLCANGTSELIAQTPAVSTELNQPTISCNYYMDPSPLNRSTGYGEEQVVSGNYQAVAQQYNGLSGQLKAVWFRGRVNPASGGSANTVRVVVYNANLGLPGTIIGSVNVAINSAPASYEVLATFATPLNVNGDVIISVEPFSPATDNFFVQRNNPPDGQFLNLIKIKQANQWFKNLAAGDPSFDFDFMILPVTSTNVTAAFSASTLNNITTFTNSSVGATSYEWDFGDGNFSTAVSPSHTYSSSGVYNVKLRALRNGVNLCVDSVIVPVNVILTSFHENHSGELNLWLSSNIVTDSIELMSGENLPVVVVNASGQEITKLYLQRGKKELLETGKWPAGLYFISGPGKEKIKIVKIQQ
jgi:hypothetical protein